MIGADWLASLSGIIVGLVLGLVGGGGSILAVPLLIYVVGIGSTHVALGTSAIAVSLTAMTNLVPHWRAGRVKWRCAGVFAAAGIVGAYVGSSFAKIVDGDALLLAFGALMLVVGLAMVFNRHDAGDPEVRLSAQTARILLPLWPNNLPMPAPAMPPIAPPATNNAAILQSISPDTA